MKRAAALLAIVVVVTGCYSVVTVNLGVNKEAVAPAVICEELAKHTTDKLKIETLDPCKTPPPEAKR